MCVPNGGDATPREAPIFNDLAVHQQNLTLAAFRNRGIMGDQYQGRPAPSMLFEEAVDDEVPRCAVEIPGRLVGQQQLWSGNEGAGDRDALLLAARKLAGVMHAPVLEADSREGIRRGGERIGAAAKFERDCDIF